MITLRGVLFFLSCLAVIACDPDERRSGTGPGGWEGSQLIGEAAPCGEPTRRRGAQPIHPDPRVAVDPRGNGLAVWAHSIGSGDCVTLSSRYVAGRGWDVAPQPIESMSLGVALAPRVAMDGAGNAVAVWEQHYGWELDKSLRASRFVAGEGWTLAEPILTDLPGSNHLGKVAADARGNAIVAWYQYTEGENATWSSRSPAGAGWERAKRIDVEKHYGFLTPDLGFNGSSAMIVWRNLTLTETRSIVAARLQEGSGWQSPQTISMTFAPRGGLVQDPAVALDVFGNALAVWEQSAYDDAIRDFKHSIWANRFEPGTGWGRARPIEVDTPGRGGGARLVMDGNGNGLVLWHRETQIRASRFERARGWQMAEAIATDPSPGQPFVAIQPGGDAIAVWTVLNGVLYSRFRAGFGWTPPEPLNRDEPPGGTVKDIAVDPSGNALVVGLRIDADYRWRVWADRFAASR